MDRALGDVVQAARAGRQGVVIGQINARTEAERVADLVGGNADEIERTGGDAIRTVEVPVKLVRERHSTVARQRVGRCIVDRYQSERLYLSGVKLDIQVIERVVRIKKPRRRVVAPLTGGSLLTKVSAGPPAKFETDFASDVVFASAVSSCFTSVYGPWFVVDPVDPSTFGGSCENCTSRRIVTLSLNRLVNTSAAAVKPLERIGVGADAAQVVQDELHAVDAANKVFVRRQGERRVLTCQDVAALADRPLQIGRLVIAAWPMDVLRHSRHSPGRAAKRCDNKLLHGIPFPKIGSEHPPSDALRLSLTNSYVFFTLLQDDTANQ